MVYIVLAAVVGCALWAVVPMMLGALVRRLVDRLMGQRQD